jgi:hypothetical protein
MFKPMIAATASLAAGLAGCDDGEPRNVTKIVVEKGNPPHEKMLKLSETDRMLALRRAVQDEGGSCPRVTDSAFQQMYEGMAMWNARCSNGDWAIYVAPSGIVQTRKCAEAKQLGLPECLALPAKEGAI